MKKVLIIGSKGMAGHVLNYYLRKNVNFEVIDIARDAENQTPTHKLDVTDFKKLDTVLKNEKPSAIINCIGILNRDAEINPDKAILLNSYFPHFLAKAATEIEAKLIHISTDCVFNGTKGNYTELSEKDGLGLYAQTKALGEVNYGNHLTFRTSIIGPELKDRGIGLFHWFMTQQGEIKGYRQAYWTGVTTIELAKATIAAIEQDIRGLHHLVNNEKINKYELTSLFKKTFKRNNVVIEPFDDYKVDKSLIKTNNSFNYTVPSYETMIDEMKSWIDAHQSLYNY